MTFTQDDIVQLVCTRADTVFCTACLEDNREQDPGDQDPNNWFSSYIAWSPEQPCQQCGRTSPYDEDLTLEERLEVKRVRQARWQPSAYLPDTGHAGT